MSKKKILVVEDEPHIANIIKITLEAEGFEVLVANDGAEGLSVAKEQAPDLVVLDLMLPKIDGYKVCRFLKFDKRYSHIPVMLLSAMSDLNDKKLGEEVGADMFLSKPFKPDELLSHIDRLLGENQQTPN